jgi:amino acid permease
MFAPKVAPPLDTPVESVKDGLEPVLPAQTIDNEEAGRPEGVKRLLRARHTQMIAIGGILGSGGSRG